MTTQLQVLSSYSLLQSTIRLPQLIQQAKQLGYQSVALTDVNVTYGLVDFYRLAKKNQIRPLLGMTLLIPGLLDPENDYPLIVIAKNVHGYHNLLKLSTQIQTQTTPLDLTQFASLLTDLVLIVPQGRSELEALLVNQQQQAPEYLQRLQQIKPHDLYVGLDLRNFTPEQINLRQRLSQLQNLACVILDDVQYLQPKDAFSQEVLHHVATGEKLATPTNTQDHSLRSAQACQKQCLALNLQTAWQQTVALAQECQVELQFQRTQLPHFATPQHLTSAQYLTELAQTGLKQYFAPQAVPTNYQRRLAYELRVINQMGYADYFLIVRDVVQQAHQLQILTGPGRGSAASSLVSFALQITQIDPLKYDLLFERFLNPERVDMPDIDLDIPDNRREELVQYMQQKYGQEHMAQIITFGTFAAKQALRDVGRVMGLSQVELKRWSQAIPQQLGIKLATAYQQSPTLRTLVEQSSQNQTLFQVAQQIEGLPRHFSTHAAGIVLSQQPLTNTVALQAGGSEGTWLTQQTKDNVEALGLLKIDFLGLRNLTILAQTLELVQQSQQVTIDPMQIPLNDPATLRLFKTAQTDGIFQFESRGIRSVLCQLKPDSFADIVAVNALYRPGPMQNISHFVARKHHQEPITYPDDSLKEILRPTYGILVYQEQVMQVVAQMAGFSLAQADLLRRAIAKKDDQIMQQQRQQFIRQAVSRGHQLKNAQQVFEYIEKFANYGFNKAHSVAYSQLAYTLAYLKVHYPQAFFAALLNANLNSDKTVIYLQDLRQQKIKLLSPDINLSALNFTIEQQSLRFGLLFIKHVRRDFLQNILQVRQQGQFTSLLDFIKRIDERFRNVELLTPLIKSGCFDRLHENRRQIVAQLPDLLESLHLAKNSISLFDVLKPKAKKISDYSNLEKLDQEHQYLGSYISGHPVDKYQSLKWLYPIVSSQQLVVGQAANVLLFIQNVKVIRTKKGQQMAFITGSDQVGTIKVTVFPRTFQAIDLIKNQVYLIRVKVTTDQQQRPELIADKILKAAPLLKKVPPHRVFVKFQKKDPKHIKKLMALTQKYPGETPVIAYFSENSENFLLNRKYWIKYDEQSQNSLMQAFGKSNCSYQ